MSGPRLGRDVAAVLAGNEQVVLCEANASLGIEWLSSNAGVALGGPRQRGSVLSLVAPESRGFVSRAIFRAAKEKTTRVRVRANDGRDADLVVVADNDYLRAQRAKHDIDDDPRLSRASGSSYAIGLFVFDSRRPPGGSSLDRRPEGESSRGDEDDAERVGRRLATRGDCLVVLGVEAGAVVDALGGCEETRGLLPGGNPLELVAAADRPSVAAALSTEAGAPRSVVHRAAVHEGLALWTCAPLGEDRWVVLVYVAKHREQSSPTHSARTVCGDESTKKRKRVLSILPEKALRGVFDEASAVSSPRSPRDDDEDWGHFVFPDGEPDFNLPPIEAAPRISHDAQPKDEPPASTRVVIDIDSLLPRQQSIDDYRRALETMPPAPAVRYSALKLDSLINTVLPRPESIAAFRASMRQLRRRPRSADDDDVVFDDRDDDDDDDCFDEQSDLLADLVDGTAFAASHAHPPAARHAAFPPESSRLSFPLRGAHHAISCASSPPSSNVPMDVSALSGSSASSSSASAPAAAASKPPPRTPAPAPAKPPGHQVHIVG